MNLFSTVQLLAVINLEFPLDLYATTRLYWENQKYPASDYKSSEEGIEKDDDLFLNPKSSQNQKITLDPSIVKNYSLVVESDGKKPNSAGAERNVIVDDPGNGFIDDMF